MILQRDAIYYHASGMWRAYKAGEESPGEGWQTEPFPGVDLLPPEATPAPAPIPKPQLDHDFDGQPGGSLPKARRKYVRKAK